jgi:FkbM family methyltransferase
MQDWCERLTYFLGRYYELPLELLLRALLARGETFIDAGANIGMITLAAAACVGRAGGVHAFEPNPAMVARLRETVVLNTLENVSIHPVGLSDARADLLMTTVSQAGGWGTFGKVAERIPSLTYGSITARVERIDDLLPWIEGPVVMKVDVEGFECRVLRGAAKLIERLHPAIITEVEAPLLQAAGASAEELFDIMGAAGYVGYQVGIAGNRLGHGLSLREVATPGDASGNVLWVHPASPHRHRIASHIVRP